MRLEGDAIARELLTDPGLRFLQVIPWRILRSNAHKRVQQSNEFIGLRLDDLSDSFELGAAHGGHVTKLTGPPISAHIDRGDPLRIGWLRALGIAGSLSVSRLLTRLGRRDYALVGYPNPASGYSIVNAENIEAVEQLLEGCPIVDRVSLYEALPT